MTAQAKAVERDILRVKAERPRTTYRRIWKGHSAELWNDVQEEIRTGLQTTIGKTIVQDASAWKVTKGAPSNEEETLSALRRQTYQDVISKELTGRTLSERVYYTKAISDGWVDKIILRGIAFKWDQEKIAHEIKDLIDPNVPGGVSYAANRLAFTELEAAHHESTKRLYQSQVWVTGVKWHLSSTHPEHDECDKWNGTIFKVDKVPIKPHPLCICYITSEVLSDRQFARVILSGSMDRALAEVYGKGTGPSLRKAMRKA
jgi:hypothetical protein